MKARNRSNPLARLVMTCCFSGAWLPCVSWSATNQFWNPGGTGGDGNWGTSPGDKNWNLVSGAGSGNTAWPDTVNDVSVFQDAVGGTVTVFDPVQTHGIIQNGSNYTINAGSITLVQDATLTTPWINVQTGTLTIDSVLEGADGLIKSGNGVLVLSSSNTYSGQTSVSAGTLSLTGSLLSGTVDVSAGATLSDQAGGLGATSSVTNAGSFSVNAAEAITTYTQNGSGILAGTDTLTATSATLNGGTVSGNLLGNTTSTGTVLVSGSIGGGSLSVTGGTLTLSGLSTNSTVGVSSGASLIDSNGGLSLSAIVTNAGTLTVNAAETIGTYTQNGSGILAGTNALMATSATLNGGTVSGSLLGNTTSTGTVLVSGTIGGGSLSVTGGTLTLSGTSTNSSVGISSGAVLIDSNGGLSSSTIFTNAGTLTVNAAETITSYTQNSSGVLDGSATLTATSGATLNGGTVSGGLSGNTTSTGTVLVSGSIGGGSLSVTSGTLTLTGTSTSTPVAISAAATLVDSNGGLDVGADVTNAGTLTVDAADSIKTYTQNASGLLNGAATLTAVNGATLNGGIVSGNLLGDTTSTGTVLVSGSIGGGLLSVSSGTLTLTGTSSNSTLGISSGATLIDSNGGLSSSSDVTNTGTFSVNAADTIATYTQNGSGILAGTNTLTVNSATLNGGTVSGNLSGATTSTGTVLVSGSLGGGSLSVTGGTLTLSGTSTNGTVGISSGAALIDSNGGLSSSAIVTNAGALTVNAAETITTYTQNGSGVLDGSSTLTTTSGATLNGGTVSGSLLGNTTSTGAVLISGSVGGGSLSVTSGTLTLTGISTSTAVAISAAATLVDSNGGLDTVADVTNAGTLTINADDTIQTYTQNGSGLLNGTSTLTTTSGATLNGGTVSGSLLGSTTSTGTVLISGTVGGGSLSVTGGTLTLSGTSTNSTFGVSSGATLIDSNGGLSSSAIVTNAGTLTVDAAETITTYTQNGSGVLDGSSTLTTTSGGTLNGGTLSGNLLGDTTSTGTVLVSGTVGGGFLSVTSGTLTLTGTSTNTLINIASPATLIDSNGGLSSSAIVANAGTFTVNAAETISNYTQNGSGILSGTDTLTATSATLNGGTVSGSLSGNTTSTGTVFVSGSIGGGSLSVTGGILTLSGTSTNGTVGISSGAALIDSNGGLSSSAIVTNAGTFTVNAAETISNYTQNGSGVLNGSSTLSATSGATLNGGTISGSLFADVTSTGTVLVSGTIDGGVLTVTGGILSLSGTSNHLSIGISSAASLIDINGGLNAGATLTNAGLLTLTASDQITRYVSNGGTLTNDPGVLTTTTSDLNDGSVVAGHLVGGTITSNGLVSVSGSALADVIRINSGTLTNSGILGTSITHLDLATGATLIASGTQNYDLLTTSGAGTGTWQGNLVNPATIAPGSEGSFGSLQVTGDFSTSPTGFLKLDIGSIQHDQVTVGGLATFGGTLELSQLGGSAPAPFIPIQVVAAGSYSGNISSLVEDLDGAVFFNPGNGEITLLVVSASGGGTLFGATGNQTATWISLYDDVIDPGVENISFELGFPPGYDISSGIADAGNPDLLWALSASFVPGGLDSEFLNRLSPEVYLGFQDFSVQSTRTHQRSALSAPSLRNAPPVENAKDGLDSKHSLAAPPSAVSWEIIAAADYFHGESDTSLNFADAEMDSSGILTGARVRFGDQYVVAGYLAADSGSIRGRLIDADVEGWSTGITGRMLLERKSQTFLTAGISYGTHSFDGTRESASATSTGWSPGRVRFSGVDSSALDLFVGLESVAFEHESFRLISSALLRYDSSSTGKFAELTGAGAGSPIALVVDDASHQSLMIELALRAQAELTERLTIWSQIGFNAGISEDPMAVSGRFSKGSRPMRAEADGLGNDLFFVNLGASYSLTKAISVGLAYRSEIHDGGAPMQSVNLSSTFSF